MPSTNPDVDAETERLYAEVAGAWEARFSGGTMEVRLDVFERPGAKLKGAIEVGFGEVAASLGARGVSLP